MASQIGCPHLCVSLFVPSMPPSRSFSRLVVAVAELGPLLGGGSRLQPGPVTLLSAPRRDEARAPERSQSERTGVCDWDGGLVLRERTPELLQPRTWRNPPTLESSGSQQTLVISIPVYFTDFGTEKSQWIHPILWTMTTQIWVPCLQKLRKSKKIEMFMFVCVLIVRLIYMAEDVEYV